MRKGGVYVYTYLHLLPQARLDLHLEDLLWEYQERTLL